jgi:hypothetical protein
MPLAPRHSAAGIKLACLAACWATLGLPARASGDDLRPSWECLPADTAVMIRLPRAAEFVETLRTSTRFGAIALRPDRLEGLWRLFLEQAGKGVEEAGGGTMWSGPPADWEKSLEKYGLTFADFGAAFSGDVGGGLVVRQREGDLPPLGMLLIWAEPGEEVAGRMLAAAKRRLEEEAAEQAGEAAPRRVDLELAGREVISVVRPVMTVDLSEIDVSELTEEDADGEDEADRRIARIEERIRAAKLVQTGQSHSFLTVSGGRLLYGMTLPPRGGKGPPADLDRSSGSEEAQQIFGSFLAAHEQTDEPGLARVLREPALASAALPGLPLVEVVVMPRTLAAREPDEQVAARLAQVGIDDVGGVVWRQAIADGVWRSALAVTLPAPRHGIFGLLDQPCDACDVPSFVTREVVDFTQISLDLGAAFRTIREVLGADASAEQLTNMLNVADVQATTWLGADVATVLSGLGSRHWILSYPPRIAAALAEARTGRGEGDAPAPGIPTADTLALVWAVADEAPLLKLLGRLAPLAGGEIKDEQGFRGLRLPGEAGAFVGRGHVVLAVGAGTLEKVLTAIRNPPAGDVSWRESDVLGRARALLNLPPARLFAVGDSTQTGGSLGTLRELVAALEPGDVEEDSRELLAAGQKLLPTAAEMEGMFGVGASVLRLTDDGLVLESAWEMPAP